jgi:hypothetical protein
MGSPKKASENLSMLGGILPPFSVCPFALMAEMMMVYFSFFFGTKKLAFL